MDTALRVNVRMLIWTDMAPSCANAVATAATARNGMNMGFPFGVGGGNEKAPRVVTRATARKLTPQQGVELNFEHRQRECDLYVTLSVDSCENVIYIDRIAATGNLASTDDPPCLSRLVQGVRAIIPV